MKKIKVLISDDIEIIVKFIYTCLKNIDNLEFYFAYDGKETYQKINKFKPDIVIVNYIMPYMTGTEIIKKTNKNLDYKKTCFLLTTGDHQFVLNEEMQTNKKINVIYKPFDAAKLLDKFNNLLELCDKK